MTILEVLDRARVLAAARAATDEDVRRIQDYLGIVLPADYKILLMWSNGAELEVGSWYISLWPLEQLEQLNTGYGFVKYVPGLLGIGTDGGSLAYALDYRDPRRNAAVVSIPLGDLSPETVQPEAESLTDLLQKWLDRCS